MKIKNYTTSVPVERTIMRIEELLVEIGATGISKQYKNGNPVALTFTVKIATEKPQSFLLPSKPEKAIEIIKEIKEYKNKPREWIIKQSQRTSWRILFNWVEVQCAMIKLKQAEAMQVFLPYLIVKEGVSLYEGMVRHGITNSKKMLLFKE